MSHTHPVTRTLPIAAAGLLLGALLWSGEAFCTADNPGAAEYAEGRILVKPRAGLDRGRFEEILRGQFARVHKRMARIGVHLVEVPPRAEKAVMRALARNKRVEFAELDRAVSLPQAVPNDTYYANGWHLPKIGAEQAWNGSRADGVIVAVLDTGVDPTHPDLANKLLAGRNAVYGTPDPDDTSDVNGHGTMVAGTVAAQTDNFEGVASVAPDALILPVRVSDKADGGAWFSTIAEGLMWAAEQGARVANISYAVTHSFSVANAAQHMRNLGGVVVVAAGNNGSEMSYADSPYMITVSATDTGDNLASWSSYGAYVDLAAPGLGIWTTRAGGAYGAASGTSFSSPVTAGVAALVMAANPDLTPDEVEGILRDSAQDLGGPGEDSYFGHGRVDASAAVSLALGGTDLDTQAPSVMIFSPDAGSTVDAMVNVEVSAEDDRGVSEVMLYANGVYVGSDATAPYQFSWDSHSQGDGPADLIAYAYDAEDNEGVSPATTVTIANVPNAPPTAAFHASQLSGEAPLPIAFDASAAADSDGSIVAYDWEFGDGSSATGRQVTHTFEAPGTYLVTLTVTDDAGDWDQATTSVSVSEPAHSSPIELDITTRARGSRTYVFLDWQGAQGSKVHIFRQNPDGSEKRITTSNDGGYWDRLRKRGSFSYQLCQTDGTACSPVLDLSL